MHSERGGIELNEYPISPYYVLDFPCIVFLLIFSFCYELNIGKPLFCREQNSSCVTYLRSSSERFESNYFVSKVLLFLLPDSAAKQILAENL